MRMKKQLSVMLIVVMIASLFAGTAVGQPRSAKSGGRLFNGQPLIFVSEENQVPQKIAVASPASAALEGEELTASPSDAASFEMTDGGMIVTPQNTKTGFIDVTIAAATPSDASYSGKLELVRNWFKSGTYEMTADEELVMERSLSIGSLSELRFSAAPDILDFDLDQENGTLTASVKSGKTVHSETEVTVNAKDSSQQAGIALITVTPAEGKPEVSKFLAVKEAEVGEGETRQLALTEYGEALMASSSDAVEAVSADETIVTVEKNTDENTIDITGVKSSDTPVKVRITYEDMEGTQKTDICDVTVTPPVETRGEFFTSRETILLTKGSVEELPLTEEALAALRGGEAVIRSNNTKIADISEKSGSTYYAKGIAVGTTSFRVDWDGQWDECPVSVEEGKKAKLFALENPDEPIILTAGENLDVELTDKALDYVDAELEKEEEERTLEAKSSDENVVSAELNSDDTGVILSVPRACEGGDATVTLRIGKYIDTCLVRVERDFVRELREALVSLEDLTEAEAATDEGRESVKAAVSAVKAVVRAINSSDQKEALNNLKNEEKEELEAQMDIIANLEQLLPKMNPNISLPEPDMSQAPEFITGFECSGAGLGVDLDSQTKTSARLVVRSAEAKVPGQNLSPDAVAMDITLAVKKGGEENDNSQPQVPIRVRMDVPEGLGDKLAVYHVHDGRADMFEPLITDGTMTFYITKLSTFVIDKKDVQMAEVLVNKAVGGYTAVSSVSEYGGKRIRTIVPVGEKVQVPVGTTLQIETRNVSGFRYEKMQIETGGSSKELTRNSVEITLQGDTEITAQFEKHNSGETDPNYRWYEVDNDPMSTVDGMITSQLSVYDYTGTEYVKINAVNFEIDWAELEEEYEEEYVSLIRESVTLSKDGVLKTVKALPNGDYDIPVTFEYMGKRYSGRDGDESGDYNLYESAAIYVGISVSYVSGWFMYHDTTIRSLYHLPTEYISKTGETFAENSAGKAELVKMYGGYTFDGWYDRNMKKVPDSRVIDDSFTVYAVFVKDGKKYDPTVSTSDSGTDDGDDDKKEDDKPSGGGRRASSGHSASYDPALMFGNWIREESGWRFRQHSGRYAANQWGKIDGAYYYFGADSYMMTGWVCVNEKWYYLNPAEGSAQGQRMTGWIVDPSYNGWFYLDASGVMQTGWQQIDGKWYYLNPISDGTRGRKLTNQWIDGYYLDENGVRQ